MWYALKNVGCLKIQCNCMTKKKVTHSRATIFKIVRNVCFTEKVFAIIGEMCSILALFVSTICRDLNTYSLTQLPGFYKHF